MGAGRQFATKASRADRVCAVEAAEWAFELAERGNAGITSDFRRSGIGERPLLQLRPRAARGRFALAAIALFFGGASVAPHSLP